MEVYETENGKFFCDTNHYIKVRQAREKAGLPCKHDSKRIDHELIGKKCDCDGKTYTVDYVVQNWHWGNYLTLALVHNRSHRMIFWENLTCAYPPILESIDKNRKEYSFYD